MDSADGARIVVGVGGRFHTAVSSTPMRSKSFGRRDMHQASGGTMDSLQRRRGYLWIGSAVLWLTLLAGCGGGGGGGNVRVDPPPAAPPPTSPIVQAPNPAY